MGRVKLDLAHLSQVKLDLGQVKLDLGQLDPRD